MKKLLDCEHTRQIGNLLNEDYYKIRIGQFNEHRLEDKIKEKQLEWLDEAYDYIRSKMNIKAKLKQKQQIPCYYLKFDTQSKINLRSLENWRKELERKLEFYSILLFLK